MLINKTNNLEVEIKKFGYIFTGIFTLVSVMAAKLNWQTALYFPVPALFFLIATLWATKLLKPLYWGWMKVAFVLNWIMTRIILGILYYGIVSPIGIVIRIFGNDPIRKKNNGSASSYWIDKKEEFSDKSSYKRLF